MNATVTLWHKHMRKSLASPEETFGMLIQPILWMVLFCFGMKSMLAPMMPGADNVYVAFFAPSIVALSALSGAIAGGSVWLDERLRGIVKEYLVAPIPRLSILLGNASSIVTKSLVQAGIIFFIGVLMGARISADPLGWLGSLALTVAFGLGFAGVALAAGSRAASVGAYHSVIFLLGLPLLFLSNGLYPLTQLPAWMAIGAQVNPTSYLVDGLRQMALAEGTTLASGEALPLWLCFTVVGAFAVLGMSLGYAVFKKTVQ